MWRMLKDLYSSNKKTNKIVKFNGIIEEENDVIANKLNEYFIHSIKEIVEGIQKRTVSLEVKDVNKTLVYDRVTKEKMK